MVAALRGARAPNAESLVLSHAERGILDVIALLETDLDLSRSRLPLRRLAAACGSLQRKLEFVADGGSSSVSEGEEEDDDVALVDAEDDEPPAGGRGGRRARRRARSASAPRSESPVFRDRELLGGTVTPIRFHPGSAAPREDALGLEGLSLATARREVVAAAMDTGAAPPRGAKRICGSGALESESDADADTEEAVVGREAKRRRERLGSPCRDAEARPPAAAPDFAGAEFAAPAPAPDFPAPAPAPADDAPAEAVEAEAPPPPPPAAAAAAPPPPEEPLAELPGLGALSGLPPEVAVDVVSRLNAAELGRLEATCRGARGTPGLVELAILRVKRRHYGVATLPLLARETWPRVLQRWEWTRSSRSLSKRMDGVAAALDSLALDKQRGLIM